jgi:hypothetical protein
MELEIKTKNYLSVAIRKLKLRGHNSASKFCSKRVVICRFYMLVLLSTYIILIVLGRDSVSLDYLGLYITPQTF